MKKQKKFKGKKPNDNSHQEKKKMSYYKNGRRYYKTKIEAFRVARKGDRIYYDAFEGAYYIVRPQRRSFWSW